MALVTVNFGTFHKNTNREELAMAKNARRLAGPRRQRPRTAVDSTSAGSARPGVGCESTPRISRRAFVGRTAGAALAVGALSNFIAPRRAASDAGTVVVMAWENYVHAEIQKRFTAKTGITMRGIPADSDQDMFTKLQAGGGGPVEIRLANPRFRSFY